MDENWCVLCIAVVMNLSVEQAFNKWQGINPKGQFTYTDQDVEDMVKMRETMTYRQIGQIYGLSDGAVYRRIDRYKKNRPVGAGAAS
jgi:hypothetical protein